MLIKAVGLGRLILLVFLFVLFAGAVFYNQIILKSQLEKANRGTENVAAILSSLEQKTVKLQEGFKFFTAEKDKYYLINQNGFFDIQGRFEARQRFEAILEASNLLKKSQYSLKPANAESYSKLSEAGYQVLSSDMELNLLATKDLDIFKYIFYLQNGFPGVISINSLELSRIEEVTQPVLRKLGTEREETALVQAKIEATWRSATQKIEGFENENSEEEY